MKASKRSREKETYIGLQVKRPMQEVYSCESRHLQQVNPCGQRENPSANQVTPPNEKNLLRAQEQYYLTPTSNVRKINTKGTKKSNWNFDLTFLA